MTDDSAFKKQARARMAETGAKYTVARRMLIAEGDPGQPLVILRVHMNPHVDLELTAEAARVYATADEQGRQEMAGRLLADQIDSAGSGETGAVAASNIMTGQGLRFEAGATGPEAAGPEPAGPEAAAREAAENAGIRRAVQRSVDRAVGVSAVEVSRAADRVRVSIRAARPVLIAGRLGEEADLLRGELEELTGQRVRLDIWESPSPQEDRGPQEEPGTWEGPGRQGSGQAADNAGRHR